MPLHIRRAAAIVTVVLAWPLAIAHGQRPERQHDVVVPGLGVRLREGWQMFFHDNCRYAVPGVWRPAPDRSESFAPDGSSVMLWSPQVTNWQSHKSRLKSAYSTARVREDSDLRLWIEAQDNHRIQHYITVTDGATVCAAVLSVRNGSPYDVEDVIAAIVESIGPVSQWPADLR